MEIKGKKAVIVGGASGMAKAIGRAAAPEGRRHRHPGPARARPAPRWPRSSTAPSTRSTSSNDDQVESALADAVAALGGLHIAVNTAGGGIGKRTLSKDGPHPLEDFRRMIELNLIGTFNLNRLQAWHMSTNEPEDEERGVIIDTASIAAFEGQIGQVAYTAAKAGIAGMMLTMARDLGSLGIRAVAIAPEPVQHGPHRGHPRRVRRRADQGCRVPQAPGPGRGVRQARRGDRGEPDAQRPVHPPRRRPALRAQVSRSRSGWTGVRSIDLDGRRHRGGRPR